MRLVDSNLCETFFDTVNKETVGEYDAIALTMEAVIASETSASFYETTRRNIPEDRHLHIRRHENLKSRTVDKRVTIFKLNNFTRETEVPQTFKNNRISV
jgi:hypothetical protein